MRLVGSSGVFFLGKRRDASSRPPAAAPGERDRFK
jgi:hypothetical protein